MYYENYIIDVDRLVGRPILVVRKLKNLNLHKFPLINNYCTVKLQSHYGCNCGCMQQWLHAATKFVARTLWLQQLLATRLAAFH